MKKLFSILLVLITSISLTFGTVACGNRVPDSTPSSDSQSSDSGEGEQRGRDVDYFHVKIDGELLNDKDTQTENGYLLDGDFYASFDSENNVDCVLNYTIKLVGSTSSSSTKILDSWTYFVDGYSVSRQRYGHYDPTEDKIKYSDYSDYKDYVGSFNEVIDNAKKDLSDPDSGLTKDQISAISGLLDDIKALVAERGNVGDLGLSSFDKKLNLKTDVIDGVKNWLVKNENVNLITAIAALTKDTDAAALKAKITKIFEAKKEGEISVADVIDRLVAFANSYENVDIDLKKACDDLQEQSGVSTAAVVDFVKNIVSSYIGGSDYADEPQQDPIAAMFPPVLKGQTAYDYFHALLKTINVNDLLAMIPQGGEQGGEQNGEQTLNQDDAQPETPTESQPLTWEQIGATIVSMMEKATVSEILGDRYELILNYLERYVKQAIFTTKLIVDDYAYPFSFEVGYDVTLNPPQAWGQPIPDANEALLGTTVSEVDQTASLILTFDYADELSSENAARFVIPSDLNLLASLDFDDDEFTFEQAQLARTNGLVINIIPASGIYADSTVSVECYPLPDSDTVEYVKIENGKVLISSAFFTALDNEETDAEYRLVFACSAEHQIWETHYYFKKLSAYSKV